ncbi:uncharacterized protein LOC128882900 isoform X2 [Hylaeus volcanicus]|uniref:uncharacterized protein LOC128882900 isoform X2 n=1 Tax=Hylaeus volcanicus TaxID=313075 RepID=UPI0023B7F4ED|nr:uncharacterized protein LOC128882900 isoform X2 [Hylaeus volcanicus]
MPSGGEEMNQEHIQHKKGVKGGKVKKSCLKEKKERHNPKAFTFSGGVKSVQRRAQYALDHETKREHAKLLPHKETEEFAPPIIVAVQGPPGVGKTTLISSLVKHYTRFNVTSVNGPITLVAGKKRRITFLECQNDVESMLDIAKVADLVLVMIDGSFGFEMETFEFLNILQVHGFPKVIGVLTHLDTIREISVLRKTKKKLKARFWAEIYNGAKLFYLSGLQFGRYNKTEIFNLSRFLAVQKPRPLTFRSQRPYLVALRYEDQTSVKDIQNGCETRTLHFYGYVKGATLRPNTPIHIPGAGDFTASSVLGFVDPCALPLSKNTNEKEKKKKRTLKIQERRIYAPDCDIGHINFDADTMYIKLPEHETYFTRHEHLESPDASEADGHVPQDKIHQDTYVILKSVHLVRTLQSAGGALNQQIDRLQLRLMNESTSEVKPRSHVKRIAPTGDQAPEYEDANMLSSEASYELLDDEENMSEAFSEKNYSNKKNYDALGHRVDRVQKTNEHYTQTTLQSMLYEPNVTWSLHSDPLEDSQTKNLFDDGSESDDYLTFSTIQKKTDDSKQLTTLLGQCDQVSSQKDECQLVNDSYVCHVVFPEMKFSSNPTDCLLYCMSPSLKSLFKKHYFITGGWDDPNLKQQVDASLLPEILEPLQEIQKHRERNREEELMERDKIEQAHSFLQNSETGLSIGTYCRIVVQDVPTAWVLHLKRKPRTILLGGLLPTESGACGFLKARIKKHRWAPKILKTEDPLLFSCGWRRFQSIPMYCIEDRNDVRIRYLKYTPEHMHCLTVFYGPFQPTNSGVLAIRNWSDNVKEFRISATGVILEMNTSFAIMKKLKLVGIPQKIYKNTAFIKNMFNTNLEVAKFTGSKIQTISGIRGQIKKAQGNDGVFRAKFEDKIIMSDIVLCKTWIQVKPKTFWNPVLDVPHWRRLKTMVEIRHALSLPQPDSKTNEYGGRPYREPRRFNPLRVPEDIRKNLPFKSLPKDEHGKKRSTGIIDQTTTPGSNLYEKKVTTLLQRLHLITKQREQERKRAASNHKMKQQKIAEKNLLQAKRIEKDTKKRHFALKTIGKQKTLKRLRMKD